MALPLEDAMQNIGCFSPTMEAKIKFWYPKLEASQRSARTALANMMHVLNAPPISVAGNETYNTWLVRRKTYIAAYDEAWKQYQKDVDAFESAPLPACTCPNCLPRYMASKSAAPEPSRQSAPEPSPQSAPEPAKPLRRSRRLAAKPRINYEEPELEEEIEAREAKAEARKAESEAMRRRQNEAYKANLITLHAAVMRDIAAAESEMAKVPKPDDTAYLASLTNFRAKKVWLEPASPAYRDHQAISHGHQAAVAAYKQRIKEVAPSYKEDCKKLQWLANRIAGL